MKFLLAITCIVVLLQNAQRADALYRSNGGVVRRCGYRAQEFLQWFCMDNSFRFPFPAHSSIIHIIRDFGRHKGIFPFVRAAVKCCQVGCRDSEYQKMCDYDKKIQRCERRHQLHPKKKRRTCRMNPALLI